MNRSTGDGLALGVKGRLSNQEMELLRNKLAQAVAYEHRAPGPKRAERQAKALTAAKPMTKVYRRVDTAGSEDRVSDAATSHRPGRKTLASIQYEAKFTEHAYDSLRVPPPSKGMSLAAKTQLQDAYVTKPRVVSTIPVDLMPAAAADDAAERAAADARSGKRQAPVAIPQVFLL